MSGQITTAAQVRQARADIGWAEQQRPLSIEQLSLMLRLSPESGARLIRRWESGDPIPGPYALALEALRDGWRPRR